MTGRKHVIHVVPAITKEASGPSYSVVRLCQTLVARGHVVRLAALSLAPLTSPPDFLRSFPPGVGPRRLGRSPELYWWLAEQVRSGGVNLLHNHGMWQMNALYPGWATRGTNVKLVVSPRGAFSEWAMKHGSWSKVIFWPALQRPVLKRATCFHATAWTEYEDIRRLGFRQPVAVIPNGIDVPPPACKPVTNARTLLYLGRLHPVKGLEMLLAAWQMVQGQFPLWRLVVAGSDDGYYGRSGYLGELQALARALRLERVAFVGELRGAEKLEAYQKANLFVLPSYSENFGIAVAEALAAGTPAVVTKGAPWEGLDSNQAGWWIEPGVDSLAACLLLAMAKQPGELAQCGLRGREWMIRDFSWKGIGEKMDATYEWLLNGGATPSWVK